MSVCLCGSLAVCLPVYLSIYLYTVSICLSVRLSIYHLDLSICIYQHTVFIYFYIIVAMTTGSAAILSFYPDVLIGGGSLFYPVLIVGPYSILLF